MRRIGLAAVAVIVIAAACGGGDDDAAPTTTNTTTAAPSTGDAAAGEAAFQGTCSTCHGADATGITGLGKPLIGSEFAQALSDGELVDFLKIGRPTSDPLNTTGVDMPPRGGNPALSDSDLLDIVAYLRSIN